jgi:hypothetical protein
MHPSTYGWVHRLREIDLILILSNTTNPKKNTAEERKPERGNTDHLLQIARALGKQRSRAPLFKRHPRASLRQSAGDCYSTLLDVVKS